jgi:hypothetical protein
MRKALPVGMTGKIKLFLHSEKLRKMSPAHQTL